MKIAVATEDWTTISNCLGRNKGMAIFEIQGQKIKSLEYRSVSAAIGSLRYPDDYQDKSLYTEKIAELISDCDVLICTKIEIEILEELKKKKIVAHMTDEIYVKNALELFLNDSIIKNFS